MCPLSTTRRPSRPRRADPPAPIPLPTYTRSRTPPRRPSARDPDARWTETWERVRACSSCGFVNEIDSRKSAPTSVHPYHEYNDVPGPSSSRGGGTGRGRGYDIARGRGYDTARGRGSDRGCYGLTRGRHYTSRDAPPPWCATANRRPGGIRTFTPHDDAISEASVAAFAHTRTRTRTRARADRVRPAASASARREQGYRRIESGLDRRGGERSVNANGNVRGVDAGEEGVTRAWIVRIWGWLWS